MRFERLGAALLLAALVTGCGGNSTPISVAVTPSIAQTVIVNGSLQFGATVGGSSTNTVTWEVCLPPLTIKTNAQPQDCQANNLGTITQNGLYTAPAVVPTPATVAIVAFSTVNKMIFGFAPVTIVSGVTVSLNSTSVTVAELQSFVFKATVNGTNNKALTWEVNNIVGGNSSVGTIVPGSNQTATYTAPDTTGTFTVTAVSGQDQSASASAAVAVASPSAPNLLSLDPNQAAEGSVQQDVYLAGTGFLSTDTVNALANGAVIPASNLVFISTSLLRATLPAAAFQSTGTIELQVQRSPAIVSSPVSMTVVPVRPAVIASSPETTSPNTGAVNVLLTGGFFSTGSAPNGNTQLQFNGAPVQGLSITNSRQLAATLPQNSLVSPGLYPLVVQNLDALAAGTASVTATNIAVEPLPNNIPGAAILAGVGVGKSPSATAIDHSTGLAYVLNTGDASISVFNMNSNALVATIPAVGMNPTGIAIDDLLSPPVALVVSSGDNTVSAINLATNAVTLNAAALPPLTAAGANPFAIGINPLTHHGIVVNQSTNLATAVSVSISGGVPSVTVLVPIGGTNTNFSSGKSPSVAIDRRLNWAVIAPGGAGGVVNLVDLGRDPIPNPIQGAPPVDPGRDPLVVGTLNLTTTVTISPTGVGVDTERHTAIFVDPNDNVLTTFGLLDNSVNSISFVNSNPNVPPISGKGFVAADVNPITNEAIVVNGNGNTAAVTDLGTGNQAGKPLQPSVAVGTSPQAVAVDPATNHAIVANQADNTISIVSLGEGSARNLQILEASPQYTFTSSSNLTLSIIGSGFTASSQVLLDAAALPAADVKFVSSRELVATVPGTMLGSARRYIVTVSNPGGGTNLLSNATDLTVVQQFPVGASPIAVAVDTDRDLAVVTNSGDNTASLVDLTTAFNGVAGPVGAPVPTGTSPLGVAVMPRFGLALVTNNLSNNVTVIDETGVALPITATLCNNSACNGPAGVAIDQDSANAVVTNTGPNQNCPVQTVGCTATFLSLSTTGTSAVFNVIVDQNPMSVAIDPDLGIASIGTSSLASSIQLFSVPGGSPLTRVANSVSLPTGMIFDPVNQVFLAANRQLNSVLIVDPSSFVATPVRSGIDPASLDYNFQTSTLVTANNASNTLSVLDYVCPPNGLPSCTAPAPQVRDVLPFSGSQQFSVAVDPKLGVVALVDQTNRRLLVIPLPH